MQAIAPAVSMLVTVGISMVVIAVVSFLLARHLGGGNKRKRQAVFGVTSFVGILGVMFFVYLRMAGGV